MEKIKAAATLVVLLVLLSAPYLALVFLASIIIAGVGCFIPSWSAVCLTYLIISLPFYCVMALLTVVMEITFGYRHCCFGLNTFSGHLQHALFQRRWLWVVRNTFLWPIAWYAAQCNLRGWGLRWGDMFIQTCQYWFIERRQGMRMEVIDFGTGESSVTYAKNPEEVRQIIRKDVSQMLDS